jgi:glycosyltransferase involved in cell wall biosynthesis
MHPAPERRYACDLLLVEPWYGGSHRRWVDDYVQRSALRVEVLHLPARYWKWRMQSAALNLARQYRARFGSGPGPARILASDMLDLAAFAGLLHRELQGVALDVFFHENQLLYPLAEGERRDNSYGYKNFLSALTADRVFFNSAWHRRAFLDALPGFLAQFPDRREVQLIPGLRKRCKTLPLGLDLQALDAASTPAAVPDNGPPVLLWNHRWEYDKEPRLFFETLEALAPTEDFRLVVLGEERADPQGIFARARERLADRILHWGFVEDRNAYAHWLRRSHILPVCSRHDFFGASVVEALYAGCRPVLPDHWVYPELLPEGLRHRCCYAWPEGFRSALQRALREPGPWDSAAQRHYLGRFDWTVMAPVYDRVLGPQSA